MSPGHPRRGELEQLYRLGASRRSPFRCMARGASRSACQLAEQLGVQEVVQARNGDMVRLAPGAAEIIDDVPVGRLYQRRQLILTRAERRACASAAS